MTPEITAIMVYLNLILNNEAAIVPVQAPVMGKGIATNNINPNASYRWTISALFLVWLNSQLKKALNKEILESAIEIGCNKKYIGITGIRFPISDSINIFASGIPK